jgi:hypothetical protein
MGMGMGMACTEWDGDRDLTRSGRCKNKSNVLKYKIKSEIKSDQKWPLHFTLSSIFMPSGGAWPIWGRGSLAKSFHFGGRLILLEPEMWMCKSGGG